MRVLLKISGEAFGGDKEKGFDGDFIKTIASDIKDIKNEGNQVVIVLGGGNIFRGAEASDNIDRSLADYIGMLATVMNGVYLHSALNSIGCSSKIVSAIDIPQIGEKFIKRKALDYINEGNVLISVGGTGNPYFTTDSAGVLRALELECDMMIKATKVDGVYDKDPKKFSDAIMIEKASYNEVLSNNLKVMDQAGIALARDGNLTLKVVNMYKKGAMLRACLGENEGTTISK